MHTALILIALIGQPAGLEDLAHHTVGKELLPTGEFESPALGWVPSTGFNGELLDSLSTERPHAGDCALFLDARDSSTEVGVRSEPIAVQGGATYLLRAYVRWAGGGSGYKVTLDWIDGRGQHIAYANDWKGSGNSPNYVLHGGAFRAPDDAAAVSVLLGVASGAAYVFDDVSLQLLGPVPAVESFGPLKAVYEPGGGLTIRAVLANRGGQALVAPTVDLRLPEGVMVARSPVIPEAIEPGGTVELIWTLEADEPGVYPAQLALWSGDSTAQRDAFIVVAPREWYAKGTGSPRLTLIEGPLQLEVARVGERYGPLLLRLGGDWAAVMRGIAEIVIELADGRHESHLVWADSLRHTPGGWVLAAAVTDGDGTVWRVEAVCTRSADSGTPAIDVLTHLTPSRPALLLALRAPMLFVGDLEEGATRESALFPGLDYVEDQERSSDTTSVAPPDHRRYSVHPYKVTLPMVSIAKGDISLALDWDPLQRWDGEHPLPTPLFASPNSYYGMDNHLMGLMAPSIPDYMAENEDVAVTSLPLNRGQSVSLAARIRLARDNAGARGVAAALADRLMATGLAPLPPMPCSFEDAAHLCATAMEAAWHEDEKGWEHTNTGPVSFDPQVAACALRHIALYPQEGMSGELRRQLAVALSARDVNDYPPLGFLIGNPLLAAESSVNRSRVLASAADGEGLWTFRPDDRTAVLGSAGDTEIGLIAEPASHLLRSARAMGDSTGQAMGLAGVRRLNALAQVPAGGETWEVPLHAPNLRAAAMAVDCNVEAYRITGDREYLAWARHWAFAGMAFIYQWQAPDRDIMPYATISVFGATFYTGLWFGNAVQWVGLVYAEALRDLALEDSSFPWAQVARGITISAMQQQKTAASPCSHVGYYPDSYSPVRGEDTYHWCLEPHLLTRNVLAELNAPLALRTTLLRSGNGLSLRVTSLAQCVATINEAQGAIELDLPAVPEDAVQVLISFVSQPQAVTIKGETLVQDPALQSHACWAWDAATHRLAVRAPGGAQVRIQGVQVTEDPAIPCTGIPNGDFGRGLLGWSPVPPGRCILISEADGAWVRLHSDGDIAEAQLTSRPALVEDTATYLLSARVRMIEGAGQYKVTIDWLDAWGRHIAYDNDWLGTEQPREWTPHGGRFTPPPGTRQARVILGVKGEATCDFDDVTLSVGDE